MASKTLLVFESKGRVNGVEPQSVRELLMALGAAECEWVEIADLPAEFRRAIGRAALDAE